MPIPDYQTFMLPLLRLVSDGEEHRFRDATAKDFQLTEEDRKELLPSKTQALFDNRVGWACTYLKKAKVLESTRRSYFRITDRGRELLRETPDKVDKSVLQQFSEFIEFNEKSNKSTKAVYEEPLDSKEKTPEEMLQLGYEKGNENNLLNFFEG